MLCGISQSARAADAHFAFQETLDITIKVKEGQTEEEAATEVVQELVERYNLQLKETEDPLEGWIHNFEILPALPAGGGRRLRRRQLKYVLNNRYVFNGEAREVCDGCPPRFPGDGWHLDGNRRLTMLQRTRQLVAVDSMDQIIDIRAVPLSKSDKIQMNATYAKTVVALTKDKLDAFMQHLDGLAPDDESRPAVVAEIAELQGQLVKDEEELAKAVKLADDLFDAASLEEQEVLLVKKTGLEIDEAIIEKSNRDRVMEKMGN